MCIDESPLTQSVNIAKVYNPSEGRSARGAADEDFCTAIFDLPRAASHIFLPQVDIVLCLYGWLVS